MHDGFKNKYYFVKDRKSMTFIPLSLKHVYKDQLKLKSDNEGNGSEKSYHVVNCEKGENSMRHKRREKSNSYKRKQERFD
jgi:hypothetical protein